MNQGQKKFFDFILERTKAGRAAEAESLLKEGFAKQADGTFTPEYLAGYTPQLLALLKPEHVDEVRQITEQFGKDRTDK